LKKIIFVPIVVCSVLFFQNTFAQDSFATIEKNVNVDAKHLIHDLNKTKDTLLLKSDKKINYFYSINKDYKREVNYYVDTYEYKLPLVNLSKGRHVFVVGQSPLKIVFVVRILKEIPPTILADSKTATGSAH